MKHMTDASAPQKTGAEDVIWDLSVLYSGMDDPMIDSDINKINQMADEFVAAYRGRVAEMDAEDFVDAFKKREAIYDLGAKVSSFASLNYTVYSTDENWGAFMQKIQETFATFQQKMVFFGVEWNAVEDAQAEQILADPTLGEYQYHLETMRLSKPYSLSEAEERVIIMKDVTGNSAWTRFFDQLMAAQSFEWDGETINQPQLLVKLYDKDRDVRQRAAGKMTEALREKSMELTYIYNTLAADKAQEDKLRGYESWITSRNIANRATSDVVDALVDSVTSRYDIVARHYHIKRALLGVDELYDYDRYAPLDLKESEAFYTWEQARDIVLNAYEAFSPSVADVARKFFDENWIHAPAMKGKRGGAYASYGSHSTHPFVFVNFNGTANDVMTLAHELGHGVHMYLAARNQNIFGMYTPLTTAEMASTFGEMLVFRDLLSKESDDEVRLSMIASKIEDTFATVFRQTAMNRFEDGMHTARRTEGELRTERLNEIWMENTAGDVPR
jgi:oligoendopeptidase F